MALFSTELNATSDPSHTVLQTGPPVLGRRPQIKLVLRSRPRLIFVVVKMRKKKKKKRQKDWPKVIQPSWKLKPDLLIRASPPFISSAGADSGPLIDGTMPVQAVHTLNQKINQPNWWSLWKEHSVGILPWPGHKLTARPWASQPTSLGLSFLTCICGAQA